MHWYQNCKIIQRGILPDIQSADFLSVDLHTILKAKIPKPHLLKKVGHKKLSIPQCLK